MPVYGDNNQSILDYVTSLKKIAMNCAIGQQLDDELRDILLCGVNDSRMQNKILDLELSVTTHHKCIDGKVGTFLDSQLIFIDTN